MPLGEAHTEQICACKFARRALGKHLRVFGFPGVSVSAYMSPFRGMLLEPS